MKKCKGKVNFKNEGVINNIKQQGHQCERMGLRGRWKDWIAVERGTALL